MWNIEFPTDRAGNETVGGGHQGAKIALVLVTLYQIARFLADHRADAGSHEFGVPVFEVLPRSVRQRLQLKVEKLENIQRAGLVLLEEFRVACFKEVTVEDALADQM